MTNEIVLSVFSNGCTDLFPLNTLTDFRNVLPDNLNIFESQAEVQICLSSVSFCNHFINVSRKFAELETHIQVNYVLDNVATERKIFIQLRHYMSVDELVSCINMQCPKVKDEAKLWFTRVDDDLVNIEITKCVVRMHSLIAQFFSFPPSYGAVEGEYIVFDLPSSTQKFSGEKKVTLRDRIPKCVFVKLDNLTHAHGSEKFKDTIAVFPFLRKSENFRVYAFETYLKEYACLNVSGTRSVLLRVRLLDELQKPLSIDYGQTSFARFHVRKMNRRSFLLRLSSLDISNSEGGINTNFRHMFPNAIDFRGKCAQNFEMCLCSAIYPSKLAIYTMANEGGKKWDINGRKYDYPFFVPITSESVPLLVNSEEMKFDKSAFKLELGVEQLRSFLHTKIYTFSTGFISVKLTSENKRFTFRSSCISPSQPIWELVFDKNLAYLIGLTKTLEENDYTLRIVHVRTGTTITFECPYDIDLFRLQPALFLLYADVVVPSQMGRSFANILKIIPNYEIVKSENSQNWYESTQLEWVQISVNDLSCIELQLRQTNGALVNFADEKEEIIYTFAFREKK